jgi:hypothetical protein
MSSTSVINDPQKKQQASAKSLFWSDTSGGLTPAGFVLVVVAIPLFITRKHTWGALAVMASICMAILQDRKLAHSDKLEIRYHILSAEDLMAELEALEEDENDDTHKNNFDDDDTCRVKYLEGLSAMAKKYSRQRDTQSSKELPLWCQQVCYAALRRYSDNPQIIAGAVSLLALIAKDSAVRKLYKYQKQEYGLDKPIACLKLMLEQARAAEEEEQELYLAEVLRKGCLFLGALCNNDNDSGKHALGLATIIVQEHDGLEFILQILNWFRCHEDVCNWALWAIFTMAFDNMPIKVILVREQGIPTICQTLKENPTSLEVNRHGIALLFDLLRENQNVASNSQAKWDPWEVRKMALVGGLHQVVYNAMVQFSDSMDIMMMGQEMLIGTGFQGDVPVYQQAMA